MKGLLRPVRVVLLLGTLLLTACSNSQLEPVAIAPEIVKANEEVPFPIRAPQRLPTGYDFRSVQVHRTLGYVSMVEMVYSGPTGSRGLVIHQAAREGPVQQPAGGEQTSEEVSIGEVKGYFVESGQDSGVVRGVQFSKDGVWMSLTSTEMSKTTIMEVAKSMLQ